MPEPSDSRTLPEEKTRQRLPVMRHEKQGLVGATGLFCSYW